MLLDRERDETQTHYDRGKRPSGVCAFAIRNMTAQSLAKPAAPEYARAG
jgi:hypothetical protein